MSMMAATTGIDDNDDDVDDGDDGYTWLFKFMFSESNILFDH